VVNRMKRPWRMLRGATYSQNDRYFRLWKWFRRGNYTSNGVVFAVQVRSRPDLPVTDLFCFALLADFRGYYPGYSERIRKPDYLTWGILKAYTDNPTGTIRLRSNNPDDQPEVRFNSFDPKHPGSDPDLAAVVTAIRFVRQIADSMGGNVVEEEEPGRWRSSDDALRDYVRDNAWGHHACGSCAMKPEAAGGVVDSRFRVHGVDGLRVVDASIFPRIPGYFLVSAVYMIAEKAADTILADLREP
jgi:choline dehydrogenase-like flavoprotein